MVKAKPATERKVKRTRLTEAQKDKIVTLYNKDYRIRDIADECGVSDASVYRVLRERRDQ